MSIKDRLSKKTVGIFDVATSAPSSPAARPEERTPKTAPGQMLAFQAHMKSSTSRIEELEVELKGFSESVQTRKIDSALVDPSKWANRHESSFAGPEFLSLKAEIEHAGGNVQPILVRPSADRFEVVFGHRRLRACKELGLPVLAMIQEVADKDLFTLMDRENRERESLSPYEQGDMWRKALDAALFPSARKLASDIGVSPQLVDKCLILARLPAVVLSAFASPTALQVRWGPELRDAAAKDLAGLSFRAAAITPAQKLNAPAVFASLLDRTPSPSSVVSIPAKTPSGASIGQWRLAAGGPSVLTLNAGVVTEDNFQKLQEAVAKALRSAG